VPICDEMPDHRLPDDTRAAGNGGVHVRASVGEVRTTAQNSVM
jgi:hypothetical protein